MRWGLPVLLPALALAGWAQAQPLSPNDPNRVLPQSPPPAAPAITAPAPPTPPSALEQAPRFTLKRVDFVGAKVLSPSALAPAWTPYAGREVSLAGLRDIAARAEGLYAAAGYPFVAVILDPQPVVGGEVRFTVVEGKISSLTVLGQDRAARRQATAAFQPLVGRQPLPASDVEAAYERAAAVPGLSVAGGLEKGDEPGGMDLALRAQRRSWNLYVNVNDLYPDALGPWGALVGLDWYGGAKYGEEATAQAYESLDGGRQTVVRLSYERGLTEWGTTVSIAGLGAWASPGRAVQPLELATNVLDGRIALSQPILLRLNESLSLTAAFEADDQKTRVFQHIALTHDDLRIASLALDGDWRGAGGALLAFTAELRQGLGILGASRKDDPELSRFGADPEATVGRFGFQALSPRFLVARFAARVEAQVASGPLTAPEQYQVGNLSIGRGYQPGANFGDEALGAAGEIRLGPFPALRRFSLEPFAFYDRVRVWMLTPGDRTSHTLASLGGGVRMEAPHHLHIELMYAAPQRPALGFAGEPTPRPRVLLNATMGLTDLFAGLRHHTGAAQ